MNLKQLCVLFTVGGADGMSSGAFSVERLSPHCSYLKNNNNDRIEMMRVTGVEIPGGFSTQLFMCDTPRFDSVFGDYDYGNKSTDIREAIMKVVEGQSMAVWTFRTQYAASVEHITAWIGANTQRQSSAILARIDTFQSEQRRLTSQLQSNFVLNDILKDPEGNTIVASPVKPCADCGRISGTNTLRAVRASELDDKGFVTEDDHGNPKQVNKVLCGKCLLNDAIPYDDMHSFIRPNSKTETTFKNWPFDITAGVELETLKVGPVDFKKLKETGWRVVSDGSVKSEGSTQTGWKGIEYNSPPKCGDDYLKSITEGMGMWAKNSRVNASCGMHVHVSWEKFDNVQRANIRNFLIAMENVMFALQPASRQSNSYCRKWTKSAPVARPDNVGTSEKYMGVNFSHANSAGIGTGHNGNYGTVEFRMGAGTRNPSKVLKWSELCIRLVEIGSEFQSKDGFVDLRSASLAKQIATFEHYAREYDWLVERPTEFLDSLLEWIYLRMGKFGHKVSKETVQITIKPKESFGQATVPQVEDINETFEERLGIA